MMHDVSFIVHEGNDNMNMNIKIEIDNSWFTSHSYTLVLENVILSKYAQK